MFALSKRASVPKSLNKMSPFVNPYIQRERFEGPFVNVFLPLRADYQEKKKKKRRGETTVARNPVRLPKQQCSLARSSLSAPLLLLVLGIRQLIPPLNTLARSP